MSLFQLKAIRWRRWVLGVSGLLLVGCGNSLDRIERDQFQGAKRFEFGNFVVVEVRSAIPASYEWSDYNHVRGDAFHVPFERVTIRSRAGTVIMTDQGVGNQQIVVNGRQYPVPTHRLLEINEAGRIQLRDDPRGGHSAIPSLIRESDLHHLR